MYDEPLKRVLSLNFAKGMLKLEGDSIIKTFEAFKIFRGWSAFCDLL